VTILIALIAASLLTTFKYEISRAQNALNGYGLHSYRDERIHLRQAKNGSTIETYCAVTQHRDMENGRVKEELFYWIVRLRPAKGYLSDYSRGTWEGAGSVNAAEFQKLCVSEDIADDTVLLSSENHKSEGSTYDPTTDQSNVATSDWLVGSWVIGASCATSADYIFRSDGSYEGVRENGQWRLAGNRITLGIERTNKNSDDTEEPIWTYHDPKLIQSFGIVRTGFDEARINVKYRILRC
jgi:hypothetical protein